MARTEIHSKFERQIQAIESVAKETRGVASAITDQDREANIPDLVILLSALLQALQRKCFPGDEDPTPVSEISLGILSITTDQQTALSDIGFSDGKVQELYRVICPDAPDEPQEEQGPQLATGTTPTTEPKSPPPTSPPRGKVAAKKR